MSFFSDDVHDIGVQIAERKQSAFSNDLRTGLTAGLETQNLSLKEKILVTD